MKPKALSGSAYLMAGFRMLGEPTILPFFLVPVLVNMFLFTAVIAWSVRAFSGWKNTALDLVPGWLSFLEWILLPIFILFIALVVFYGFALIGNLIAAPFNGLLAERVAARLRPARGVEITSVGAFLATIPASLFRELRKLAYFALLAIAALIVVLIPVLTPFAPFLWFVLGAWTLAFEYCDFQADNDGVSIADLKIRLRLHRGQSLGFGAATLAATMVPVVNLVVMPAAVCGATLMWVEQLDRGP